MKCAGCFITCRFLFAKIFILSFMTITLHTLLNAKGGKLLAFLYCIKMEDVTREPIYVNYIFQHVFPKITAKFH